MSHPESKPQEDDFFISRLSRLLDCASLDIEHADLPRFLLEPNTLFENRVPWDLIMEPSEEEFEILLAGLRTKRKMNRKNVAF